MADVVAKANEDDYLRCVPVDAEVPIWACEHEPPLAGVGPTDNNGGSAG